MYPTRMSGWCQQGREGEERSMGALSLTREELMAALGKALAREAELRKALGLVGSEDLVEAVQGLLAERDALREKARKGRAR